MGSPPEQHEVIDLTLLDDSSSEDDDRRSGSEDHDATERDGQDGSDDGSSEDGDSDTSEIELHLSEETRTQLRRALASVSEARLRGILDSLIETDQAVEVALTRELITVKREGKKVVPRWTLCVNCEEEYDVNTTQEEDECVFHPGAYFWRWARRSDVLTSVL